ncbi:MAG TPA: hypothetical protein VJH68_02200 [Candidatus Nanoarchaeia archaeon]|nr:hypothetical protein [Candidatus Nanoarchaeia archaeon]
MKKDKIIVDGKEYQVHIYQEPRTNVSVSIGKTGVQVRLPLGINREEMFKEIFHLKNLTIQKIKEKLPKFNFKYSKIYRDQDVLEIGNKQYLIRLYFNEKQSSSAKAVGNTFHINVSSILPEHIRQKHICVLLSRLIAKKKRQFIEEKMIKMRETASPRHK